MFPVILKKVDSCLGQLVRVILRPLPPPQMDPPKSFLFIRPGGIGDAVLLVPALVILKSICPDAHICIFAEKRNAGVFTLVSGVDAIWCYDRPREFLQVARGQYDVVIDTEQWHRLSAVVTRLLRAPVKIGFDTNERRRMFTHTFPYSQAEYEAISFVHLLSPFGIDSHTEMTQAAFLTIPDAAACKADELLKPVADEILVTVFPGASIPERRWGADRFRRVAELLSGFGVRVVVVGGREDHRLGEVVAAGGPGLNLAGLTSLAETAAVIQKSALLLSGDSGILHIAVGLGVPTVSLFGPGRAEKWAPQGDRHFVITKGLSCSPCTTFGNTPACPINVQCMNDISVEEVFNAVTMMLTSVNAIPSRCCKRDWIKSELTTSMLN